MNIMLTQYFSVKRFSWPGGWRMLWWTVAAAEFRRGWLIKQRYPLDLLFSMAGGIIFMVTVAAGAMMVTGGRLALDSSWAPRIWGLVLAGVAGSALTGGIGYINQHTYTGTLEQVALSPVSLPGLVLSRQSMGLLVTIPYLVIYAAGIYWLFPNLQSPGPMAGSVAVVYFGMMGLGFVVSGLALIFKQVQSVLGFVTMAMYPAPLLLSSTHLGSWMWNLLPYSLGLKMTMTGQWTWLTAVGVPLVWMMLGFGFLQWADRQARRKGVLGQY
jgi:hypothetical protein